MNIDKSIIKQLLKHNGKTAQLIKASEGCGELVRAIGRYVFPEVSLQGGRDCNAAENLIEEVADVYICLEIIKQTARLNECEIEDVIKQKQARLVKRMGDKGQNDKD